MILFYLTKGKTRARMAFTNESVTGIAFGTQDVSTNNAMTDIRFRTETLNACGIGAEDTYIVQHGSLLHKSNIDIQLRMTNRQSKSLVCHTATMHKQNVAQGIFFGIVFVYDLQRIH